MKLLWVVPLPIVALVSFVPAHAQSRAPFAQDLAGHSSTRASDLAPGWHWGEPRPQSSLAQAPADDPTAVEGDLLDEVSVTATRRPTRERETTATTYIVKQADFRAVGARTASDALLLVPGFEAQPALGGVRNARGLFLRGFDDQRFQVLRDGLSLTRPSNGRNDLSRLTIADLERIEIVTGGATLRYGSGAVGGIINLITETPSGPPRFSLEYQAGSYGNSFYTAKYGGGDDSFRYGFTYTGIVAFNDYPFQFTLPNSALFYGREATAGGTSLFGYLRPEVGPPITVTGRADVAYNASDTYTGKLVFKPDPFNRVTLRAGQQNSKNAGNGPGVYAAGACTGGPGVGNGTLNGQTRFLPLDANGNELACNTQRYFVSTPSSAVAIPYAFDRSADGIAFAPGQSYPTAEPAIGPIDFYITTFQAQTEAAVLWDYEITPTTTLNSYVSYYRFTSPRSRPTTFNVNTNVLGGSTQFNLGQLGNPFTDDSKFEVQSAVSTQISPGQTLALGVNFTEDRSYTQQRQGSTFLDRAIARSSIFLIDDISFSDALKANLGLRYTNSSQFGVVATPAVGLRYSPSRILSLRANWSQVFNAPAIADLFTAGGVFVPNPNLRPETGITYDVGVDFTPQPNLGLRLTYFSTYLDGAIATVFFRNPNPADPNLFLQQQQNLDSRRASGIELVGDWQIDEQFRLRLTWTNTDARQFGPPDSNDTRLFFYQFQDPNIPFDRVSVAATYSHRGWNATLLGRYAGGQRRGENAFGVSAYATLDFNFEVPLTERFTVTGNIFNLTDTHYEYVAGVPAPGITFRVGGRFELGG